MNNFYDTDCNGYRFGYIEPAPFNEDPALRSQNYGADRWDRYEYRHCNICKRPTEHIVMSNERATRIRCLSCNSMKDI